MPESPSETPVAETSAPRELTVRAFVLGAILALILGAANAYLGLYAGMTVSASIPAAVISMGILRILGRSTIFENNVVQTIASAGEAVAAGAIFTFPALEILGHRGDLPYWDITTLCLVGGTLGSLLVVFLRRTFIVTEQLPFPEGRACAEVLRAGATGGSGAGALAIGGFGAAILKALQDLFGVIPDTFAKAFWLRGAAVSLSANCSAALLGVGYIVGIEIAVLVLLGGLIGWGIAIPFVSMAHPEMTTLDAATAAHRIWANQTRYLGVGAMLVGGAATIWRLRGAIGRGVIEGMRTLQAGRSGEKAPREETDLATSSVLIAVAACIPATFLVVQRLGANQELSLMVAVLVAIIGFFATAVAGYLSGIVGASNNPVSGVTIIVLLLISLVLRFVGTSVDIGPRLAILVGAVVCTAAAMAGDSMHDLATGHHLRATPRALEIAVLSGAIISAFLMAPILNLLIRGYGIAGTPSAGEHALAAPQAFLMAKVAQGVFRGGLPWGTIALGAALAVGLLALDRVLERRQSRWRTPVMPVAIGLYLPFGLGVTILVGAAAKALFGKDKVDAVDRGLLVAAGMVAGEALTGVASGALITIGIKLPL
ncbi:MAG TPA: oligopeptide transporter, OPT family [Candidatus Binataceae bacterium]|nr:oligopeptide transporter, OPT family [Candidatus Binataceae bacterium]